MFATLNQAGVPLLRTLDVLSSQEIDNRLSLCLSDLREHLLAGKSLASAFSSSPDAWGVLVPPLLVAAEASGKLDDYLEQLALHAERELEYERLWRQAAVYPLALFILGSLVMLGLATYVFPVFLEMFKGLQIELPWVTRALITISSTLSNPVVVAPLILGSLVFGIWIKMQLRSPVGRRHFDSFLLQTPYFGTLAKRVVFGRLAHSLSLMLASGVSLPKALGIAGDIANNSIVKDSLESIRSEIRLGSTLSEQLERSQLFPRVFVQMVECGEDSGELALQLGHIARLFDDEIRYGLTVFTSFLEPVMMATMGAFVLFVLVGVFQPITSLMAQF